MPGTRGPNKPHPPPPRNDPRWKQGSQDERGLKTATEAPTGGVDTPGPGSWTPRTSKDVRSTASKRWGPIPTPRGGPPVLRRPVDLCLAAVRTTGIYYEGVSAQLTRKDQQTQGRVPTTTLLTSSLLPTAPLLSARKRSLSPLPLTTTEPPATAQPKTEAVAQSKVESAPPAAWRAESAVAADGAPTESAPQ